jgi:DNA helicase-2/ATP-dependent DNA helicase PcrA
VRFIGDLHIHSHFSIATSRDLIPERLDYWARVKGITVVGTGDFTHPGWLSELRDKLRPAEEGLFELNKELRISDGCASPDRKVRFLLSAEISNIYRRDDRVRKVHNLILAPDFDTARKIQNRLSQIGNIESDGRPILGLDSRDLLEIVLESSPRCFFIPSHIWTPWFSALGAKSGFDSIDACYADLSGHIRAIETGLSSDPPMNWLCRFLDRFTIISNSDAHSPGKLGREANLFDIPLDYDSIITALSGEGRGFRGTVEFFPQEGKYHYDGHRKCGVRLNPLQTLQCGGICPTCGKKLTIGVLNRVVQLADRADPMKRPGRHRFHSLIPLKELIAETVGKGVQSKQVENMYRSLIMRGGPELELLLEKPADHIGALGGELLAEGIRRMREGEVHVEEGYDGEYGRIRVFTEQELGSGAARGTLFSSIDTDGSTRKPLSAEGKRREDMFIGFDMQEFRRLRAASEVDQAMPSTGDDDRSGEKGRTGNLEVLPLFREPAGETGTPPGSVSPATVSAGLNHEQRRAVSHGKGPALVLAGPGTGKTRVLASRAARLIHDGIPPESILAVTFTNRAAEEMKKRLERMPGVTAAAEQPRICTFHALGLHIIEEHVERTGRSREFTVVDEEDRRVLLSLVAGGGGRSASTAGELITRAKRDLVQVDELQSDSDQRIYRLYEEQLLAHNVFDFDDLLLVPVRMLGGHPDLRRRYRERYRWIMIDEYQDINRAQYALIGLLVPEKRGNIFAIGDPDQAIYGFRGADVRYIDSFLEDYPEAEVYTLKKSYRCSNFILRASRSVVERTATYPSTLEGVAEGVRVHLVEQGSDRSEGEFVARSIERRMGGLRFFSMDSDITDGGEEETCSLADFAVLCRIKEQMAPVEEAFANHGVPYQAIGTLPFYREEPFRSISGLMKLARGQGGTPLQEHLLRNMHLPAEMKLPELDRGISVRDAARLVAELCFGERVRKQEALYQRYLELCERYGDDFVTFFRFLDLGTGADLYNDNTQQVSLMTLHTAKGLEFSCVFILGCEDGLIPFSLHGETDQAEERRLLYVGMTRARRTLILSHAKRRVLFGRELHLPRSRFLDTVEEELLERSIGDSRFRERGSDRQLDLFTGR